MYGGLQDNNWTKKKKKGVHDCCGLLGCFLASHLIFLHSLHQDRLNTHTDYSMTGPLWKSFVMSCLYNTMVTNTHTQSTTTKLWETYSPCFPFPCWWEQWVSAAASSRVLSLVAVAAQAQSLVVLEGLHVQVTLEVVICLSSRWDVCGFWERDHIIFWIVCSLLLGGLLQGVTTWWV